MRASGCYSAPSKPKLDSTPLADTPQGRSFVDLTGLSAPRESDPANATRRGASCPCDTKDLHDNHNAISPDCQPRQSWEPNPSQRGIAAVELRLRSVAETCDLLGCESEDWFLDRVRNGTFPARRVVRQLRFSDADIEAIIENCAVEPRQSQPELPTPTARSRRRTA